MSEKTITNNESNVLLKLKGILDINKKILKESNYEYYKDLKGEYISSLEFDNSNTIFLDPKNNFIIVLSFYADIYIINLKTFEKLYTDRSLFQSEKTQFFRSENEEYDLTVEYASYYNMFLYIIMSTGEVVIYDIKNQSTNRINLKRSLPDRWQCPTNINYNNGLIYIHIKNPPKEYKYYNNKNILMEISVYSYEKSLSIVDTINVPYFIYERIEFNEQYLFALIKNKDELSGELFRLNLKNKDFNILNVFNSKKMVDGYEIIDNNNIICFTNDVSMSKVVIFDGINECINGQICFNQHIHKLTLSSCKCYIGIIYTDKIVKVFDSKTLKLVVKTDTIIKSYLKDTYSKSTIESCKSLYNFFIHDNYMYISYFDFLGSYSLIHKFI